MNRIIDFIYNNPTQSKTFEGICTFLFLSIVLDTLLSLLSASWASRWVDKSKKGEDPILPSFKDRFWRSFRFIFSLSVIMPIGLIIFWESNLPITKTYRYIYYFSPCIIAILSYLGIRVYDFKQGQKQETKPIPKKKPVLDSQDKSLDVMKPLVA